MLAADKGPFRKRWAPFRARGGPRASLATRADTNGTLPHSQLPTGATIVAIVLTQASPYCARTKQRECSSSAFTAAALQTASSELYKTGRLPSTRRPTSAIRWPVAEKRYFVGHARRAVTAPLSERQRMRFLSCGTNARLERRHTFHGQPSNVLVFSTDAAPQASQKDPSGAPEAPAHNGLVMSTATVARIPGMHTDAVGNAAWNGGDRATNDVQRRGSRGVSVFRSGKLALVTSRMRLLQQPERDSLAQTCMQQLYTSSPPRREVPAALIQAAPDKQDGGPTLHRQAVSCCFFAVHSFHPRTSPRSAPRLKDLHNHQTHYTGQRGKATKVRTLR